MENVSQVKRYLNPSNAGNDDKLRHGAVCLELMEEVVP